MKSSGVTMAIKPSSEFQLSYQDRALWERGDLSLEGVREAWRVRRDPRVTEYIVKLIQLDPALPEEESKLLSGDVYQYQDLVQSLRPWQLWSSIRKRCQDTGVSLEFGEMKRAQIRGVIAQVHRELWAQVERTPDALPARLRLDGLLLEMWESDDAFTRTILLKVMAEAPLKYGPWRAMKRIFKESVPRQDWEMFGVIAARLDREGGRLSRNLNRTVPSIPFRVPYSYDDRDVSKGTVSYLVRRAWRTLREIARNQPSLYPEVAAEVLKHYRSVDRDWELSAAWLRNHILFHESKRYSAENFWYSARSRYGQHAYPELWKRSETPLLRLFEEANNSLVLGFVTEALLNDFRPALAQLDAKWVRRVSRLRDAVKDGFLFTWYSEVCPHPQSEFADRGLHEPLLGLLWSSNRSMVDYAMTYFQVHPDALLSLITVEQALAMARSPQEPLRKLGQSLLEPSAGHFKLDLSQWTTLLQDERSFEFASTHIKKIFSGNDLSYAWYVEQINHERDTLSSWAMNLLKDSAYQPTEGDLFNFYWSLLTPETWRSNSSKTALTGLAAESATGEERLLSRLTAPQLRALLLHPNNGGRAALTQWVREGWIAPRFFGARWLRDLLDRELWREGGWRAGLEGEGETWRDHLAYPDQASELAQKWLLSTQYFDSADLGAWWLLQRGLSDSWELRAYRTYVQSHLPLAQFVALNAQDEKDVPDAPSPAEGLAAILGALESRTRSHSEQAYLRGVLKARINTLVQAGDPNATPLPSRLAISEDLLKFDIFSRLAFSTSEENRGLALALGEYHYRRWTEEAPLSFSSLLPFFSKGFPEVQAHLLKAMSASPLSAEARIDVRLPQFDPEGLYAFCFSHRAQVRDLGLSLIGEHPDRFADPERVSLLVESSDRRVCEGIVHLLWEKLRHRPITTPWAPHPQSVAPQSEVAQRQATVISAPPPAGKRPEQIKGKRYIGEGAKASKPLPSENLDWVAAFLKRTLFRLSPTHPLKGDLGRLTSATPAWRNKVNLIKAIRDLAVRDVAFATLVRPILEEFMATRGRSERAACLVALTRMRNSHPTIF